SELGTKYSVGPCQLNRSDGVIAWIALASVGGNAGSFFSAQRCLPWLSRHSQGDSNVTSGAAAAGPQRRATAIVSVVRVIAGRSYHFLIAVWRAKAAQSDRVKVREIISE